MFNTGRVTAFEYRNRFLLLSTAELPRSRDRLSRCGRRSETPSVRFVGALLCRLVVLGVLLGGFLLAFGQCILSEFD